MEVEELKEKLTNTIWEMYEPTSILYKFYEKDVWTLSMHTAGIMQLVGRYEIYKLDDVLFLKFGGVEYSVTGVSYSSIILKDRNSSFTINFREKFHI